MDSPKYNRTFHLPWSKGATSDDKISSDISHLISTPIVITEKIDGSNTSLEFNGCFARTHSGPPTHASFDGLKALHSSIKYKITEKTQLFGEWVFALHSIAYSALPGYFLLFNVRELSPEGYKWLSWEMVELWAQEVEVPTVPVLFNGIINSEGELKELTESFMIEPSKCGGIREGVVVRVSDGFSDAEFSTHVAKMVRANHVQTTTHWKEQEIIRNKLL
jgi:hypothetical protein